jgi:small-conductance mechanosensitive channel
MWDKKRATYSNIPYSETIIAFYTNKDSSQIAFISEKYHYLLKDHHQKLMTILEAKKFLNLTQNNLKIHVRTFENRPDFHTNIEIKFNTNSLNKEQISWLKVHDFKPQLKPITLKDPKDKDAVYSYTQEYQPIDSEILAYVARFNLEGERYIANPQINNHLQRLNRPLVLQIDESVKDREPTKLEEAIKVPIKIAATPFTLAADALLLVGFVFIPFQI